jgi:hypothetical protein
MPVCERDAGDDPSQSVAQQGVRISQPIELSPVFETSTIEDLS